MSIRKERFTVRIADIVIEVEGAVDFSKFRDFGFYKDFMTGTGTIADCSLGLTIGQPPDFPPEAGPFRTQNWKLFRSGDKNVLLVGPPIEDDRSDNAVAFNADYSLGTIYQSSVSELFTRFIDQFLVANLLSRRDGFLLHSSGVVWEGKGLAFIGPSGAGKSTILNMFAEEVARGCLLNDDKNALRKRGDRWQIFGTPWYGESQVSSSGNAPLSTLFFIRHSKDNYVRRLTSNEACNLLMVQALLPLWDGDATSRVLGTFENLLENIPAFELGFLPDKSALELIKKTV